MPPSPPTINQYIENALKNKKNKTYAGAVGGSRPHPKESEIVTYAGAVGSYHHTKESDIVTYAGAVGNSRHYEDNSLPPPREEYKQTPIPTVDYLNKCNAGELLRLINEQKGINEQPGVSKDLAEIMYQHNIGGVDVNLLRLYQRLSKKPNRTKEDNGKIAVIQLHLQRFV